MLFEGERMERKLLLSPDLDLSSADFAAAWNASSECRSVAEAVPADEKSPAAFLDPLTTSALVALSGLGLNIASNALYDLIKLAAKSRKTEALTIIEVSQPDGTTLLIVTKEAR